MPALLTTACRSPNGLYRGVDQPLRALPRRHAVAVGNRLAAHDLDLLDDLLGWAEIATTCRRLLPPRIVDDDLGTVRGAGSAACSRRSPTGTVHDCDTDLHTACH
jgi:hypothetical protein